MVSSAVSNLEWRRRKPKFAALGKRLSDSHIYAGTAITEHRRPVSAGSGRLVIIAEVKMRPKRAKSNRGPGGGIVIISYVSTLGKEKLSPLCLGANQASPSERAPPYHGLFIDQHLQIPSSLFERGGIAAGRMRVVDKFHNLTSERTAAWFECRLSRIKLSQSNVNSFRKNSCYCSLFWVAISKSPP